ncbi:rifin [Plasmodium reichenowi]|uniref:Rifin n=1 Tax=Plasmodium reichenowi TaxID=5854 RepID=A0A060RLY8_PLARE|nr:rifin [Plasmodium reichenowi]
MKVHYINILLFALPLNILVYTQRNHKITTPRTQKIPITRLLWECELYAPANYDNDPQMKEVMENFNKQTQQRFHEYDDRMKTTREKCKEQCDKEIQKIILKDKLEKELMDKFVTLDTDIQSDAIPTCVCEKSIADKVEKGCLRCGGVLGGGGVPSVGLLGGLGTYAWKPATIEAAKAAAIAEGAAKGIAAGNAAGMNIVNSYLENMGVTALIPDLSKKMSSIGYYAEVKNFAPAIIEEYKQICVGTGTNVAKCINFENSVSIHIIQDDVRIFFQSAEKAVPDYINSVVRMAKGYADAEAAKVTLSETPVLQARYTAAVETTYTSCQTAIIASVVAIVVIVLIMVIIYKILRYRRKKKMKKKLQYIKLLEE